MATSSSASTTQHRVNIPADELYQAGFFHYRTLKQMQDGRPHIKLGRRAAKVEVDEIAATIDLHRKRNRKFLELQIAEYDLYDIANMRLHCEEFLWKALDDTERYYESLEVVGDDEVKRYFSRKYNSCVRFGWHIKYMVKCQEMIVKLMKAPSKELTAAIKVRTDFIAETTNKLEEMRSEFGDVFGMEDKTLEFY